MQRSSENSIPLNPINFLTILLIITFDWVAQLTLSNLLYLICAVIAYLILFKFLKGKNHVVALLKKDLFQVIFYDYRL